MANERRRDQQLKRGGGAEMLQLDFDSVEAVPVPESAEPLTPEAIFEKRWAVSVLRQAMNRMQEEMERSGKGELFRRLKPMLTGEGTSTPYKTLSQELDMTESALKVTVHRLRRGFGKSLRAEIAETLSDPALVQEEMSHLLAVLGS